MKNLLALLLCLTLILPLAACAKPAGDSEAEIARLQAETEKLRAENERLKAEKSDDPTPDTPEPQPTTPDVAGVLPLPQSAEEYTTILRDEHLVYSDDFNDWDATYQIPQIKEFSDDTRAANEEIQRLFVPMLEGSVEASKIGDSLICVGISYETYVLPGSFTVVITAKSDWSCDEHMVCTFDRTSGERLTMDDYAALAGVTADELREAIRTTLTDAFSEETASLPEDMKDEFYRTQQEANRSDENVDACTLYLAQSGEIWMLANVYSLAGAAKYEHLLPLTFG